MIRRFLRAHAPERAEGLLDKLSRAQLSSLVRELPPVEARALFDLLFTPSRTEASLALCDREELALLLDAVDDSRIVRLLARLSGANAARIQALLPAHRRLLIRRQLQLHLKAVTRVLRPLSTLMTPERSLLTAATTVGQARARLDSENPPEVSFVVDERRQPIGQVRLETLQQAPAARLLSACLEPFEQTLRSDVTIQDAGLLVEDSPARRLPVVDTRGRLVGSLDVSRLRAAWAECPERRPLELVRRPGGMARLVSRLVGILSAGRLTLFS
jgi:Mg/Co/Ni transporter MgtE